MTRQVVGCVPAGYDRRAGIITGGAFHGDRLSGEVLPGGSDWPMTRPDRAIMLDVRLMLRASTGDLLYVTYSGRLVASRDMRRHMGQGGTAAPGDLYFRTLARCEAPEGSALAWLNDILAVGVGSTTAQGPRYELFELL